MGSYWSLSVADWSLCSGKSELDPRFTSLFRLSDRKTSQVSVEDLPGETFEQHEYCTTVREMRDRLELLGFGLNEAKADFEESAQTLIDQQDYVFRGRDFEIKPHLLSFDAWVCAMRTIVKCKPSYPYDRFLADHNEPIFGFILRVPEVINGFPTSDERYALRAILESVDSDAEVSYDFTDLVHGGYTSGDEDHCRQAIAMTTKEYTNVSNIILLTEGGFDAEVLRSSLPILFSHLDGFFDVMDFTTTSAAGGSSFLVHNIKAFAGSGVRNRIIGIFDNDLQGAQATAQLSSIKLPERIRTMRLPDIELARDYPTIGPQGERRMDINGLASSIELFLGRDVLTEHGSLSPVQWISYDPKLKQYYGEVINKSSIQKRFKTKVTRAIKEKRLCDAEWAELKVLWNSIFALAQRKLDG
jgi:hypothetical protein